MEKFIIKKRMIFSNYSVEIELILTDLLTEALACTEERKKKPEAKRENGKAITVHKPKNKTNLLAKSIPTKSSSVGRIPKMHSSSIKKPIDVKNNKITSSIPPRKNSTKTSSAIRSRKIEKPIDLSSKKSSSSINVSKDKNSSNNHHPVVKPLPIPNSDAVQTKKIIKENNSTNTSKANKIALSHRPIENKLVSKKQNPLNGTGNQNLAKIGRAHV